MKGREWKYKLNLAQLLRFRATFYIFFYFIYGSKNYATGEIHI